MSQNKRPKGLNCCVGCGETVYAIGVPAAAGADSGIQRWLDVDHLLSKWCVRCPHCQTRNPIEVQPLPKGQSTWRFAAVH